MAYTSAKNLGKLLMGELKNNAFDQFYRQGSQSITKMTDQRARDLLTRLSTTGLGRSGIGAAALNEAYGAGGEAIGNLAVNTGVNKANYRSNIINKMLGLYQFQKEQEASEFDFGDFLGSAGGLLLGSALGPIGAAAGGAIGGLLTGEKSSGGGGGSLFMPSIERLMPKP